MYKKKLIEVALPLEAINEASAREKSIRHGHPSTLHLWWARRPLATARAVIWASLVDDPSSRPEEFPTEEEQNKERERLFKILEQLVIWENSNDETVLNQAKAEIIRSTDGNIPEFLDPFSGGGALPLEAQRLGLKAHAQDLNPVALLINKVQLQIAPLFAKTRPCNPDSLKLWPIRKENQSSFSHLEGLKYDLEYYGDLLKRNTFNKVREFYPDVNIIQNGKASKVPVAAWIWSRTIPCPNPACQAEVPLIHSMDVSKKRKKERHIEISYQNGNLCTTITDGKSTKSGTMDRKGAICPCCGTPIDIQHIRDLGKKHKIGNRLLAVVAEGPKKKIFLDPDEIQIECSKVPRPQDTPEGQISTNTRDFRTPLYGLDSFSDLFTDRQLNTLIQFSNELQELKTAIENDAIKAGFKDDCISLNGGGTGALAYSEAITTLLSMLLDQVANHLSMSCGWNATNEQMRNTFARQAIPMVWDFAECNPFSNSSGSYQNLFERFCKALDNIPENIIGTVEQHPSQIPFKYTNVLVSTDPPYYDNIEYADLSDYFYVWLRYNLKEIFPNLFSTMLVPKAEELVASPVRHGNKENAKEYFESGMDKTCLNIYHSTTQEFPTTIYYAYKQQDSDAELSSSSGWETMLSSIIQAGFSITGTWPMRTEKPGRTIGIGANALASSIVLVCRKREDSAKSIPRRKFISELKKELKNSLVKLQQSNIAPVDMAQSAIGPGMGVFSKYKAVLESDGSPMTVRSALEIINQEVDIFFNEQDSDLRSEDRFCVDLYIQCGFDSIKFGEADTLARAKNTSVEKLAHSGAVFAEKGVVHLIDRDELEEEPDSASPLWMLTQQLVRAMDKDGVDGAARFLKEVHGRHESMKALAYRLFTIAEKKNWAQEAYVYNNLVVAWPEIQDRLAELNSNNYETQTLF